MTNHDGAREQESTLPDERAPLLSGPGTKGNVRDFTSNGTGSSLPDRQSKSPTLQDDADENTPMPRAQVLILCIATLCAPIAAMVIFPFIPEMLYRTGKIREEDLGFWAGIMEAAFSLAQVLVLVQYGRASDRFGRKPCLVLSLVGISFFMTLFGFSTQFWQMLVTRTMAGFFAGVPVVVRSAISEMVPRKHRARAFSWNEFAHSTGLCLGPLIGGCLANPAERFPDIFGQESLFLRYPYALASLFAAAFGAIATFLVIFGITETVNLAADNGELDAQKKSSVMEALKTPGFIKVLYAHVSLQAMGMSWPAVASVFMFTRVSLGGLGLTDNQRALAFVIVGLSQSLYLLLLFPFLHARYGAVRIMRVCAVFYPFWLALCPLGNELLRRGYTVAFMAIIPPLFSMLLFICIAFACATLCVQGVSASPLLLGTLNGLALTASSGVETVFPGLFGSLYAVGVRLHWAHGHLVWICLGVLAINLVNAVFLLPIDIEFWGSKKTAPSFAEAMDGDSDHRPE